MSTLKTRIDSLEVETLGPQARLLFIDIAEELADLKARLDLLETGKPGDGSLLGYGRLTVEPVLDNEQAKRIFSIALVFKRWGPLIIGILYLIGLILGVVLLRAPR